MHSHSAPGVARQLKFALIIALFAVLVFNTACSLVHKRVEIEKLLSPLTDATRPELIAAVNKLVGARSIHGKVDIQFEDTSFATSGIAEKYRTADGSITLQRPGKIYLVIQAPLVAAEIAEMTSDGEHFRIAIFRGDDQYRKFVKGTNNAIYPKLDIDDQKTTVRKGKKETEAEAVNALSNLRPQHLTDALLVRPVEVGAPGLFYTQTEFFQSEKDPSQLEGNKRVVRGYYFLDELQIGPENSAHLLRRFWFDRVGGIRLARLQTFDDKGAMVDDVTYEDLAKFGESAVQMPAKISLTRPQDHYRITITYQAPESVTLDHDYPPEAFVLANKRDLPEVDLDARKNTPQNR